MGTEISYHAGYVMNVIALLKGFPDRLDLLNKMVDSGDYDEAETFLEGFVGSEVHRELEFDVEIGSCGDVYRGGCPFEPGEVYVVFLVDQLIDEVRRNGVSVEDESDLFRRLKEFMDEHMIPQNCLQFKEWQIYC